jgi:hypothetical protein
MAWPNGFSSLGRLDAGPVSRLFTPLPPRSQTPAQPLFLRGG